MRLWQRIFGRPSPPVAAATRVLARPRVFSSAAVGRLTASLSQASGAVNADLDNALVILRSRARSLCANNEYGRRFLSLVAINVVGPRGPTLQVRRVDGKKRLDKPMNDAVETHWALWCKHCDITGKLSLAMLLRIAIKSVARDGEVLVRIVRGRQYSYGIALQILEADRLDETINRVEPNGNVTRMGVEMDAASRPVALWIFSRHPGENWQRQARKAERVQAEDVYHLFNPERAEQVRGYTWLHAVLMRASMLAGYEEAAIVAARVGAAKMGVFTRDADVPSGDGLGGLADGRDANTGALQMSAEAGEFLDLTNMPGVNLATWDPDYPHENFESFVKQCLRGWASGVDVATHNLSGDMTEVNYSSARIAEQSERDSWIAVQDWLIGSFCEPVFSEWLNLGMLKGEITFLNGTPVPMSFWREIVNTSRFQGRRWEWVDPLNQAEASRELISSGLSSRTEIAASQGREFEDIVEELSQERVLLESAGLWTEPEKRPSRPNTADDEKPKGKKK